MATPACGSSAMPRYFCTLGSKWDMREPMRAPMYLPSERKTRYRTPSSPTCGSTLRSRSAPESTKNSKNSGGVQ